MGLTNLSVLLTLVCVVKCLAMSNNELEDFEEYLKKTSQLSPTLKKGVEPDDYDEDEAVSDHAWEDSGKFEGDLILNERQRRLIVQNVAEGLSRNGIRDSTKRWPNNEVIYYIQVEHFTADQVQAIQSGIDDLARASCVKFRRYRKGDRDAVVIQGSRRGCFSQVGYQGGYQVLNLSGRHPVGRGCFRHGTVIHEMLHTLGFYHMQSSPDRDDYVNVVWDNIVQQARHNFRKYNMFSVSDFGVGYDYDSVLHYSRRAFSANGRDTIIPKKSGVQIGQRLGLSDKDTAKLNKMYCDADSDNVGAGDDPTDKSKKKSEKNKPFDGHGIGYHQGKAVVIKLLPAPETYKLVDVPRSHVFDYFSKTPQVLSTSEKEGFRAGKEIEYSYKPPDAMIMHKYKEYYNGMPETQHDNKEIDPRIEYHQDYVPEFKDKLGHTNIQESNTPVEVENGKSLPGETLHDEDPELIEALDRISKIIKLRVYPSQTPDLSISKNYQQDIKSDKDLEEHKKDNSLSIQPPTRHSTQQGHEINQSAINFINNLFDLNTHETDKILENKYHPTADANGYYKNKPEEKNKKATAILENKNSINNIIDSPYILSLRDKENEYKYTTVAPYILHTDRYDNNEYNKYASKLQDGNNKWHDKRLPYKSEHDHYDNGAYVDYFKPDLEEDYHKKK